MDRRHSQATPMAAVPAVVGADVVADDAMASAQAGPAAPAGAQGEGHSVGGRIWIKKWYC